MDMGIIAALKKRYKFLLMKENLSFFDLDREAKMQLIAERNKMRRGAAGVQYGKPAHILDATHFLVKA